MATTPMGDATPKESDPELGTEDGEAAGEGTAMEDDMEEEEAPHATAEDREVAPAPAPAASPTRAKTSLAGLEAGPRQCCELGIPLTFSAWLVTLFDIGEAAFFLQIFYTVGWRNAFVAGFILKWALLIMCLFFGEGLLRSRCCMVLGCCGMPLQLWVRAHRMARDIFVSSIIFWIMAPFVILNSVNEYLCPGCSAHQLLIYRDPGHLARKEAVVLDILGETADDWGLGLESDEGPGEARLPDMPPVPPPITSPIPEKMD